ncbi:hypothetical protein [Amycolatopsis jejuensis]|uniref:hypothetical protein n=1 Tax=Amycolatopsis jejuensis TaxID=330084 RepID=UPI000524D0E0|nr:hypothetical protein [Amycolatopsis jejuensis]
MNEGLPAEVRELFRLPAETADPALVPLIASLTEAISGMAEVDVRGVVPDAGLPLVRGWSDDLC